MIIPFVRFDGHRWREARRAAGDDLDVPVNLDSVPARWWAGGEPAAAWQVWTVDGGHSVLQSVVFVEACDRNTER